MKKVNIAIQILLVVATLYFLVSHLLNDDYSQKDLHKVKDFICFVVLFYISILFRMDVKLREMKRIYSKRNHEQVKGIIKTKEIIEDALKNKN